MNILYKTRINKKKNFNLPDVVNEKFDYYKLLEKFFRSKINFVTKSKYILNNLIRKF